MQFSLKTLMLTTWLIPPVAWLIYATLWRFDPERPLKLPDPVGLLAVVAWVSIYYNCVHRRNQIPKHRPATEMGPTVSLPDAGKKAKGKKKAQAKAGCL